MHFWACISCLHLQFAVMFMCRPIFFRQTNWLIDCFWVALCAVAPPRCSPGSIPCPGGGSRCVYENWLCDGDNDCGDNSDEDPQVCRTNGQSLLISYKQCDSWCIGVARQLWGTGTRAPSTSNCLSFLVASEPHKIWHCPEKNYTGL